MKAERNVQERSVQERSVQEFLISDVLWERIGPLIPVRPKKVHPLGCHRPRVPDRQVLDGIFFVLRTGCQWKALDATGICSGSTAHLRFQEWEREGFFVRLWEEACETTMTTKAWAGVGWHSMAR
jgi:putative transposase